jgi:hypothetical protein
METATVPEAVTVSSERADGGCGFIHPPKRLRQIHVTAKLRSRIVFLRAVGVGLLIIGAYDSLVYAYQLIHHVTPQAVTPLLTEITITPHIILPILAFYWTAGAILTRLRA